MHFFGLFLPGVGFRKDIKTSRFVHYFERLETKNQNAF